MRPTFITLLLVVAGAVAACGGGDRGQPADVDQASSFALSLEFDRQHRTYTLFVPEAANDRPRPLVIVIHGLGQSGKLLQPATGYDEAATVGGFLVAYPDAVGAVWNTRLAGGQGDVPDDVGFLTVLVDEIARTHHVDRRRVYATGHSDGARMSYRLACERSEVFAAVAPVAGGMTRPCRPSRPMPVLQVSGANDHILGVEAADAVQTIQELNGCRRMAVEDVAAVEVHRFTRCRDDADVVSAIVPGVGHHLWPTAADGFDTTGESWKFFLRFSLRPPSTAAAS